MNTVIGVLIGLVWGVLAGLLNVLISRGCLKKNSTNALMAANLARTAVDFAALAAVYLLRSRLPFPWEGALVGTAVALSLVTIVFAFTFGKKNR